ncbi:MAG: DUF6498-containing protein [Pseudomonadales bacterium]
MLHLLTALLANAVPLVGIWQFGWSGGTILALYWIESVIGHMGALTKIRLHATRAPKQGHFRYEPVDSRTARRGSYYAHYRTIAGIFTTGHGIFLGIILLMLAINRPDLPQVQLDLRDLLTGVGVIALLAVVDLVIELPALESRSFFWLENHTGKRLSTVLVLHLTLIFGMGAAAWLDSPMGLIYVFVLLKTAMDALAGMARDDAPIGSGFPKQPPQLLRWLDRFLPADPTQRRAGRREETLDEYWARGYQEEMSRRHRHEIPVQPPTKDGDATRA